MMEIINLLKSKIARDFLFVYIGNIISAGINFINIALIARILGPYNFGYFSLLYAISGIIVIISDFGLGISVVRFSSEFHSKNELYKIENLLKISFKIRFIVSLIICIVGISISNFISLYLLRNEQLVNSVIVVFIGGVGLSIFEFVKTYLQSRQEFRRYAIYIIIYSIFNFLFIILLISIDELSVFTGILVYIIVPFIILGLTIFSIDYKFISFKRISFDYQKIMNFNMYIIIINICSMFFNRIDLLYLNLLLNPDAVGFYSAAFQMAQIMPLITNSLVIVLLPKLSSLNGLENIKKAFKKILKFSSILYLFTIPIVLISPFVIPLIFSQSYINSIYVFQLLIISFGMSFLINLFSLLIFKLDKPKIMTIIVVTQLVIVLIGDPIFIRMFQTSGVAYISIIVHIFSLICLICYLYYQFKCQEVN